MKTIINNPDKLNEIDITTHKARALILDDSNNIIITKYADIYMLPGGKIDKNEKTEEALIRELKEELGIQFSLEEITPFIEFHNYIKDYPIVDNNKFLNKLNKTIYFIIKTNKRIDFNKTLLTESEKSNNFRRMKLSLDKTIDKVLNHNSYNPRNSPFKTELIKVLEEYKNSNKLIDLHTHSNYSDGELSPNELIKQAIKNNIGTISITDHDTLDGYNNLTKFKDIKIIPGIELSSKVEKGQMHILGYNIDIYNKKLNEKLTELKTININYILSIIEQIKKDYNIYFTYEELKELINYNHNLGRPDIARLLIKKGYVKTVQEAFDKYLIEVHSKIDKRKKGIPYSECIDLILKSNGIPVLAHPKTLKLNDKDLLYLLKDMVSCGLMGIEVYHSTHSKEEIDKYLKIANELGLLISGGSDYHGINTKPDVELGTGINNNLKIKQLSILDKIKR